MAIITKKVITDLARAAPYLIRWSMWLPFGCSLKLHQIVRPDDDRCMHDHPWWFLRIILWGGYTEDVRHAFELNETAWMLDVYTETCVRKPWRPWAPWRIYWCPSNFAHRITKLTNGRSSWSLVLCGPRSQEWGFFTRSGWVAWREFVNAAWSKRVLWCEDGRVLNEEGKDL
ncbi:hypothetical protein NA78x_001771 [Anatilimnocola sp. NA78]|uniref:hypothetical protein n=1 Tax=Anatilimnocola sp. NA78 TaxID=3415683 RepID=UPI003CE4FFA4